MSAIDELKLTDRDFKTVQKLIFDLAGIALSNSKHVMVHGRLAKRVRALSLKSYRDYIDLVTSGRDPDEVTRFINALTTNKTDFYRERHHFDFLTNTVFPKLQERSLSGQPKRLRIWCSASSTGEEPYTLAITAREFFGAATDWDIRILASDIDTDVLAKASEGIYDADRLTDVPLHIRQNYFQRESRGEDSRFIAKPTIRDLITFRRINLKEPSWPINTHFDVIFCRNVMIYFNAETQAALIERFAEKLDPQGYLIIGHSESLFGISNRFTPLGETIYGFANNESVPRRRNKPGIVPDSKPAIRSAPQFDMRRAASAETVTAQREAIRVPPSEPNAFAIPTAENGDEKYSIIVGEVCVSDKPIWISTVLGSCVATCLYDEVAKVGGMNHFMLPDSRNNPNGTASFGVHAMELLINEIMRLGGDRRRLKAKFFGGGAVVKSQAKKWNIGEQNVAFTRRFLETEGIPIVSEYVGGTTGMRVRFNTHTAKVLVRPLDHQSTIAVEQNDQRAARKVVNEQAIAETVTLF